MISIKLLAVIVAGIFMFIVGSLMRIQGLHMICFTLILLPFISYAVARVGLLGLKCSRESPEYIYEGEAASIRISIAGRSLFIGNMDTDDNLPPFLNRVNDETAVMERLPGITRITYNLVADKRGIYDLGPVKVLISDPLGFFDIRKIFHIETKLTVLPSPLIVPGILSSVTRSFGEFSTGALEGEGPMGSGMDFHGVREFRDGDELRRVHWPSTARHGTLSVIEFEKECIPDTLIALDLIKGYERGKGKFTSLEYSVKLAAGIAEESLRSGSMVKLLGTGIEGNATIAGNGAGHLHAMLESLAAVQSDRDETLYDVFLREKDAVRQGTKVICLAPTLTISLAQCADMLISRGVNVHIILITLTGDDKEQTIGMMKNFNIPGVTLKSLMCSTNKMECQLEHEYTI